jgi:hypothetical protein
VRLVRFGSFAMALDSVDVFWNGALERRFRAVAGTWPGVAPDAILHIERRPDRRPGVPRPP